jgi:hypothetical protein
MPTTTPVGGAASPPGTPVLPPVMAAPDGFTVTVPLTLTRAPCTGRPESDVTTAPEIDDVPTGIRRSVGWGAGSRG